MKNTLIALGAAALAGAAGAQTLKPGLWEVTSRMQGGQMDQQMAQMQKELAGMPADQRKMMEDMMARQGMKAGPGGGAGMTTKICMTKEMVERDQLPAQQGDCRTTHQSRSGNTMKFEMACTQPPSRGEGQVTFSGSDAYTMKMAMTTHGKGKPETMNMEGGGKWLGADCGSVKPPARKP